MSSGSSVCHGGPPGASRCVAVSLVDGAGRAHMPQLRSVYRSDGRRVWTTANRRVRGRHRCARRSRSGRSGGSAPARGSRAPSRRCPLAVRTSAAPGTRQAQPGHVAILHLDPPQERLTRSDISALAKTCLAPVRPDPRRERTNAERASRPLRQLRASGIVLSSQLRHARAILPNFDVCAAPVPDITGDFRPTSNRDTRIGLLQHRRRRLSRWSFRTFRTTQGPAPPCDATRPGKSPQPRGKYPAMPMPQAVRSERRLTSGGTPSRRGRSSSPSPW
jgi:hypothetical protein